MQDIVRLLWVIGALPLFLYPCLFLAIAMGSGGRGFGEEWSVRFVVTYSVLIGLMVYPVVYGVCTGLAVRKAKTDARKAVCYAAVPVCCLAVLAAPLVALDAL